MLTETKLSAEERGGLLSDLKLLADDTRLRLLERLAEGEQCVCHLVDATNLTQGTISHHLGILRRAGWVRDRRDEKDYRWVYYSLHPHRLDELQRRLGRLLDVTRADLPALPCPPEDGDLPR